MLHKAMFGVATSPLVSLLFVSFSYAISPIQQGVDAARGTGVVGNLFGNGGIVTTFTNLLLYLIGALSVVMLIFGGLKYTVSGGNSTSVTSAKNTVLYAIVGLVIAILAYAIVNFVLSALMGNIAGIQPTNV
jgi:hypothetical protein